MGIEKRNSDFLGEGSILNRKAPQGSKTYVRIKQKIGRNMENIYTQISKGDYLILNDHP